MTVAATELTEPQRRYLAFLTTPTTDREAAGFPDSKNKMAELLGVAPKTLRDWERKPLFRDEWEKLAKDVQGSPERHTKVLDAIYRRAIGEGADGKVDVNAAKLWLQALEKIAPPSLHVEDKRTSSAAELTDDELDALIAGRAAQERQQRQLAIVK